MWDRWDRDLEHLMKKLLDLILEETNPIDTCVWLFSLGYEWKDLTFLGFHYKDISLAYEIYKDSGN